MTESNSERNARQPSVTKKIRALVKKAGWPEGGRFTFADDTIVMPGDETLHVFWTTPVGRARARFVVAACNHFLLEQELEREAVKVMKK